MGSPDVGGGGGGGAVVASSFTINSPTTINVSVNGKVGGINFPRNGGNAWINGIGIPSIVAGGGYGGLGNVKDATPVTTAYGGSGAGACYNTTTPTIVTLNPNTYANLGGIGNFLGFTGAGGGGAGSAGQQAYPTPSSRSGSGGDGKLYTSIPGYSPAINNILTTLSGYGTSLATGYLGAGGGGGCNTSTPSDIGPGGSNGAGGPGALINYVGGSATVFGGGGGGSGGNNANGGTSFQGIVMIAFK